jgi:cytochrome c5
MESSIAYFHTGHIVLRHIALGICLLTTLAACDARKPAPTPQQALRLAPADPHLAQLYAHSCKACHARPGTGAPLVHDHAAWDPRWAKGEDVLFSHAVTGFQAMPAGGQCAACTPEDYKKLIRFMADR